MTKRAIKFVCDWVHENVNAQRYLVEGGDNPSPKELAERCLAEATRAGIPLEEIEERFGDLEEHIVDTIADAADAEVDRLAEKDHRNALRPRRREAPKPDKHEEEK